jgi:hypothetical protein
MPVDTFHSRKRKQETLVFGRSNITYHEPYLLEGRYTKCAQG